MGNYDHLRHSRVVIGIILLHLFVFSSFVCADELLFVVGETGQLQVTPGLEVTGSPGVKPGRAVLCERIHIHGLGRFKHLNKYAHSLKLLVAQNVSTGVKASNIEVCFHRNLSQAVGMCLQSQWEKVSKGSWVQTMSPFDSKILDVRIASSSKVTMDVSAVEEFFLYRIGFLILGILLLCSASTLNTSLFVCLSIRILAWLFILQSSGDHLLAVGALTFVLFISSIPYAEMPAVPGYLHDFMQKKPDSTQFRNHGTNRMQRSPVSESDCFLSSFHKTPERTNLTKEEWMKLIDDCTRKAVDELLTSPGFGKWAAANAGRITVSRKNKW